MKNYTVEGNGKKTRTIKANQTAAKGGAVNKCHPTKSGSQPQEGKIKK